MFAHDAQRRAVFATLFSRANRGILQGKVKGKAMLAKPSSLSDVREQLLDAGWRAELKHDGVRAFIVQRNDDVRLYNPRSGRDMTAQFPELVKAAGKALKGCGDSIIDGEIIHVRNGDDKFNDVVGRLNQKDVTKAEQRETPVKFVAFDMLEHWGKDITRLPLPKRLGHLDFAVKGDTPKIMIVDGTIRDKDAFYRKAVKEGREGVILKDMSAPYSKGIRSDKWRKVKRKETKDLLAYGWEYGTGKNEKRLGSLLIGEKKNGKIVPHGKVGSGFSDRERSELPKKFGSRNADGYFRITPPLPVEVEYLEAGTKGGLRHPRIRYDLI